MTEAKRVIHLEPHDWYAASWRNLEPLEHGEAAPFDLQACLERLGNVKYDRKSTGWWFWSAVELDSTITAEEAEFWLTAVHEKKSGEKPKELAKRLKKNFEPSGDAQKIARDCLADRTPDYQASDIVAVCCANLLPVAEVVETQLATGKVPPMRIVAYCSLADRQAFQRQLATKISLPALKAIGERASFPVEVFQAARLGCEPLAELVASWADGRYRVAPWAWSQRPINIVLGIVDPDVVEREVRRLSLLFQHEDARHWIAHTEHKGLDVLARAVTWGPSSAKHKERIEGLMSIIARVVAPETATVMLELQQRGYGPQLAREWLDAHPDVSIEGLTEVARGTGRLAQEAIAYLARQQRLGHGEAIRGAVEESGANALAGKLARKRPRERSIVDQTPKWLAEAVARAPSLEDLPAFVVLDALPPILLDGKQLGAELVVAVIGALSRDQLAQPSPALQALKQEAVPESLDAFAWALFEAWQRDGAPKEQSWALSAVGHLGSNASALKLAPLIPAWRRGQRPEALRGVECLSAIGTDTALSQLHAIATGSKYQVLQRWARSELDKVAMRRGLSQEQLEDRIVPDCGFDSRGKRELSYGVRSFLVVLDSELRPSVRNEAGKTLKGLPKPGQKDDAELAEQSAAAWKQMKKELAAALMTQIRRFEHAMVAQRRWPAEELTGVLMLHPLLQHLAARLLWGVYGASGQLDEAFRVTDARDLADIDDATLTLPTKATVGIVHPVHLADHLGEDARAKWGERFADYEIISPFPQLGRPVHRIEGDEPSGSTLARWSGELVSATRLMRGLERAGWSRGGVEDGGVLREHQRPFPAARTTAVLVHGAVPITPLDDWPPQPLTECHFIRCGAEDALLGLRDVDPVVLSEVIRDLETLAVGGG